MAPVAVLLAQTIPPADTGAGAGNTNFFAEFLSDLLSDINQSDHSPTPPIPYLISIPTSPSTFRPVPALSLRSYLAAHNPSGFCGLPPVQRAPYVEILAGLHGPQTPYCPGAEGVTAVLPPEVGTGIGVDIAEELAALRAENANLRAGLVIILVAMHVLMALEAWALLGLGSRWQRDRRPRLARWARTVVVILLAPVWCVWHTLWMAVAWRVADPGPGAMKRPWKHGDVVKRLLAATALSAGEWEAVEKAAAPAAAVVGFEEKYTDDITDGDRDGDGDGDWDGDGGDPMLENSWQPREEQKCLLVDVDDVDTAGRSASSSDESANPSDVCGLGL